MAYYLVRVTLTISGLDFDPVVLTDSTSIFKRAWRTGDLVRENASVKFKDSGVSFELLDSIEDPEWMEMLITALRDWVNKFEDKFELIPTPLISVCIRTGGTDFPPMYFSRDFLSLVEKMKAEVDVDVIATAALERQEEEA